MEQSSEFWGFIDIERPVNEVIWDSLMGDLGRNGNNFENDTFAVRSYNWGDDGGNDWHLWHKPSGYKLLWYKYPLRDPMANMDISHKMFLDVLTDCTNSMHPNITQVIDRWWEEG